MAKEFFKEGRTIYTNNPKEIVPIIERPSSPPGIKDPPQITTTQNDTTVTQLKRNAVGMFEATKCETCPATTQHRCQYSMLNGNCFDVDKGKRICGIAICNLYLGESNMIRCRICSMIT